MKPTWHELNKIGSRRNLERTTAMKIGRKIKCGSSRGKGSPARHTGQCSSHGDKRFE